MKEKVKEFFSEKKEVIIFLGVLSVAFISIILIANLALNKNKNQKVNYIPDPVETNPVIETPAEGKIEKKEIVAKFGKPVDADCKTVRVFYDCTKNEDVLITAVIISDNKAYESTGVTYKNDDDSKVKVYASYDGVVTGISKSDAYGTIVEITHDDMVKTYYSSLEEVNVSLASNVKKGDLIGLGGVNVFDKESSNHVTYEVKIQETYIDPELTYDKTLQEIALLVNNENNKK